MFGALEAAADQLGLGVVIVRVDVSPARVVFASRQASVLLGRPAAELVGIAPWDILPPADRARVRDLIASREGEAPPLYLEVEVEHADGRRFPVEIGLARVRTAEALLAVGYFREVTERHEIVEALRRSEARFRSLVENAPDGVVILQRRRIAFMNARAARLIGLPSAEAGIGQDITSLLPPPEAARAADRLGAMARTGAELAPVEYRLISDGVERSVEIKSILCEYEGAPAVLAFARDVTERRAMQGELVRADRLAAVGTLAAAVAHEINNPLTYAQLSLQYVERELLHSGLPAARVEGLLEHVRNARHGAERVATIVRDLRTFARVDDAPPGPLDVVAVVERALKIAENDLRHRARLDRRYQEVPAVEGNASRLEQVFLNLLINALQALPEGDPTRDTITVEIAPAAAGEVRVAISDTGAGIPAHLRDRVFDPFFTTKPVGEGTGLGLSVCRGILEGLGGRIELDSVEGRGTRVTVTLREHRAVVAAAPASAAIVEAPAAARRLRVLVVDDEALVRRVLTMVLGRHHEVATVEGGAAALELLGEREFDVILCDLMMPGMSGMDVHTAIRARFPALARRVVFITGGAFVPRLAEFLDTTDNLKLLKPFDVQQVLAAVIAAADR